MHKTGELLSLYCESPVHVESEGELGALEQLIQREHQTDYPVFSGSTVKEALRESFNFDRAISSALKDSIVAEFNINQGDAIEKAVELVFGAADKPQFTAPLSFTDARLLLFPVKSVKNTFVWVTSPGVLSRLHQDLELVEAKPDWKVPAVEEEGLISQSSDLDEYSPGEIVLEEYTLTVEKTTQVANIAEWLGNNIFPGEVGSFWRKKLTSDLVILTDDDFSNFVKISTEIMARPKFDLQTKTSADGQSWYEENIPADAVFYSLALASNSLESEVDLPKLQQSEQVMDFFQVGLQDRIQLGGNQTIGRGIINLSLLKGEAK